MVIKWDKTAYKLNKRKHEKDKKGLPSRFVAKRNMERRIIIT